MDLDAVLALWEQPDVTADDFRRYYTDPVPINGVPVSAEALAARAAGLQASFADRRTELVHNITAGDKIVIGFFMHVTHVGPYDTPFGRVEATGKRLRIRVNDILTVRDDRIADVWVMSDDADLLRQLGRLPSSV